VRHGVNREPRHTRDELVELNVRHLVGDDLTHDEREAIRRVGCRTQAAGLRALDGLDTVITADVARGLIDRLRERYPT